MNQVPASILTLIAGVTITLVSIWVGQHHGLLPEQASEQAPLVDNFFNLMVTIGTALFLIVQGAIAIFLIQFRRRKGDNTDGVPIEGSIPLEIVWTAIPAIIVIGLGAYSVAVYEQMGGLDPGGHHMAGGMAHHASPTTIASLPGSAMAAPLISDSADPTASGQPVISEYGIGASPDAEGKVADLTVNVKGMQYAWIFEYPDSGITTGELHVPIGQDVQLNLSAADVIHSFWVPQFRLKQDAIPGVPTELRFVATKEGSYPVVCAELCGGYHGSMRSQVIVHSPEAFTAWLEENRIAQQHDLNQAIAVNPAELSTSAFLAPYAQEMGIKPETLAQLQRN